MSDVDTIEQASKELLKQNKHGAKYTMNKSLFIDMFGKARDIEYFWSKSHEGPINFNLGEINENLFLEFKAILEVSTDLGELYNNFDSSNNDWSRDSKIFLRNLSILSIAKCKSRSSGASS